MVHLPVRSPPAGESFGPENAVDSTVLSYLKDSAWIERQWDLGRDRIYETRH
jgi:hypothetical protein